jgi:hypothetical protein
MPDESRNSELTPEGEEVLRGILEETQTLRAIPLGDATPAAVFEAGRHKGTKNDG